MEISPHFLEYLEKKLPWMRKSTYYFLWMLFMDAVALNDMFIRARTAPASLKSSSLGNCVVLAIDFRYYESKDLEN